MNIEFQYTETLSTAHPEFSIGVVFEVEADVTEQDVVLLNLWAHSTAANAPWKGLPLPKESTKQGAMFAGLLREKAREAAKQWQAENF